MIFPINTSHPRKLIEYKYLKKDYTEGQLKQAIKDATSQVHSYMNTRQIQRDRYDAWIVIFAKDTCVYSESIHTVES